MHLRYIIPAAMALVALSFCQAKGVYAHGPMTGSGRWAGRSAASSSQSAAARAAYAAQFAATNPALNALLQANRQSTSIAARLHGIQCGHFGPGGPDPRTESGA